MKTFLNEFREFAMRGNVLDMAIGIIIGTAFSGIVTSLVGDVFLPLIGIITGGINFSGLSIGIGAAQIGYGNFLQAVIQFIFIAFCIFLVMKVINRFKRAKTPPTEEIKEEIGKEEALLIEIRDLLKERTTQISSISADDKH